MVYRLYLLGIKLHVGEVLNGDGDIVRVRGDLLQELVQSLRKSGCHHFRSHAGDAQRELAKCLGVLESILKCVQLELESGAT